MRTNTIIIGDTHFGIKNNSMTWLKHQKAGFREIIDYVQKSVNEYDYTYVVHMGDLFDSRSAINPLVFREVVNLLNDLNSVLASNGKFNSRAYIIGGNHDYYYPWESEHNYTGIQMLPFFSNITMVTNEPMCIDRMLLIPWFTFHNETKLKEALQMGGNNSIIFTHTDPYHLDISLRKLIEHYPLITGHIHQPMIDWEQFTLVTGSAFPTDFSDANSHRGFWTLDSNEQGIKPEFHRINSSIHFHILKEDLLEGWQGLGIQEDDYVSIVIKQSNVDKYKDTIKELSDRFNTSISYIPEQIEIVVGEQEALNVDTVCNTLMTERLKPLYEQMVKDCQ